MKNILQTNGTSMASHKPEWLRKKINPSKHKEMDLLLENYGLNTVCREALCPNISECYSNKQATFLILGDICTRGCSFCNIKKASPLTPNDEEPQKIANAVKELGLKHVVITSPTRDDLADGGAMQFDKTVKAIRKTNKDILIELLIPDMKGDKKALLIILKSKADIIGHNIETIKRLYFIRKNSNYERSLELLKFLSLGKKIKTKSSIMLGLGEEESEVLNTMQDILKTGCEYLCIGQYLPPSKKHTQVHEFIKPEQFLFFQKEGLKMGFKHIKSSPYARSSYLASQYLEEKNEKI